MRKGVKQNINNKIIKNYKNIYKLYNNIII